MLIYIKQNNKVETAWLYSRALLRGYPAPRKTISSTKGSPNPVKVGHSIEGLHTSSDGQHETAPRWAAVLSHGGCVTDGVVFFFALQVPVQL